MAIPIEATPPLSREESSFFVGRFLDTSLATLRGRPVNFKIVHEKIMKKAAHSGKKHFYGVFA